MSPGLSENDAAADPIEQFHDWYRSAGTEAVTVVTATPDGRPSGRMVLLRGVDERGFVFFTNHTSAKGADLAANPRAALVFYWPPDRQVRVTGSVTPVSDEDSDAYWRNRPRGSQLSAWASEQSQVVESRGVLERRVADLDVRFPGAVPRPPHWGGYRVEPDAVEFWHHRDDRLHDRLRYRRAGVGWVRERLAP